MDRCKMQTQVRKGIETMRQKEDSIDSLNSQVASLRSRLESQYNEIAYLKEKLEEKNTRET